MIKTIADIDRNKLENEVNEFIKDKWVKSINFAMQKGDNFIWYAVMIDYSIPNKEEFE